MSDEIIIQQLKDREERLMGELNKVRLAIKAFLGEASGFDAINFNRPAQINDDIPAHYDSALTYGSKILFVLANAGKPMLVDEITSQIDELEPRHDVNKLHKSISHNVSMLAKYGKVKKHPFNRKIKYSIL